MCTMAAQLAPPNNPPAWRLENCEILPETDPSFLCEVCRHVNFSYLLFDIPFLQSPDIPLGTLRRVLENKSCAFCRLVQATIDNVFSSDVEVMPREYQGEPILLSLMPFPETLDPTKPRQLVLRLQPNPFAGDPSLRQLQIQFVQEKPSLVHNGIGRAVDAVKMDPSLALLWIKGCQMGLGLHKDDGSERPHSQPPVGFRLIDVTRGCIVAADSLREYVALSYIWPPPGKHTLKLLTSNKDELIERDGCLVDSQLPFASQISQTIKDAMEVCKMIAERYLWVDALCIIQDADHDKNNQIRAMDYIYSNSTATLVSTCGDSAEAGIYGAREGTRTILQATETVQGFRLANRPWNLARSVQGSKWNTRAWTFQERVLSKRTLFLTPQQMFFKCCHTPSYISEDLLMPAKARNLVTYPMDDTGKDFIPQRGSVNVLTYLKTVENFTKRDITYPHDILNAFTGIAENMRTIFRSDFLYGLPQSELDYCLCWEHAGAIERRVCANGAKFPSWSWAGWLGPVQYSWTNRLSRVRWVLHETDERLTPDDYRSPLPAGGHGTGGGLAWRDEWMEKWSHSGFRYFYHPSDQAAWFRSPTAPEPRRQGPNCVPGTQHLQFEAETIDITMSESWIPQGTVKATHQFWQFPLADEQKHAVGFFSVPIKVATEMSSTKHYKFVRIARVGHGCYSNKIAARKGDPEPDSKGSYVETHTVFEDLDGDPDLVLVKPTNMLLYPDEPGVDDWKYPLPFDRQWYDAFRPFCLCEFLVVEMVGDVAYRIGIGRAHVDAWAQQPPKTETLTLG